VLAGQFRRRSSSCALTLFSTLKVGEGTSRIGIFEATVRSGLSLFHPPLPHLLPVQHPLAFPLHVLCIPPASH
jgi:hypothetical protein